MSPDSNLIKWFFTRTKLKFFTRMSRVMLCSRTVKKQPRLTTADTDTDMAPACDQDEENGEKGIDVNLLKARQDDGGNWVVNLQRSVKMLHFGNWDEKEAAAEEIRKLVVAEQDLKRRRVVVELGVIPPLVAMVGSEVTARRRVAVRTLVELGNGSFTNKALMVEAGILSAIPENIDLFDETSKQEFAQLFSSLSSLASTDVSLNSTKIIPITVSILKSCSDLETKRSCLNTLYNLSSALEYSGALTSPTIVDTLITESSTQKSEKALSTLGNLVVTQPGRKLIENNPMMPEALIEIMTWEENPKCQELSAYILMILAHQSSLQRRKMVNAGIVQVLLQVALLGSPLAQKRAMKLLQWFKDERQVRVGPHSGPQVGRFPIGPVGSEKEVDEGKRLMKKIVNQSLYKNMETITLRANGAEDSMKLKAFVTSSSSKSLPY